MKEGNAEFFDTNVLIYAALEDSPFRNLAWRAMDAFAALSAPLWISRQVLREYIAAFTRFSTPLVSTEMITRQVRHYESRFRIAEDGPAITATLLSLLESVSFGGKQVHDANIVATALAYDIPCIVTHNIIDFSRFSSHIDIIPLETFG